MLRIIIIRGPEQSLLTPSSAPKLTSLMFIKITFWINNNNICKSALPAELFVVTNIWKYLECP